MSSWEERMATRAAARQAEREAAAAELAARYPDAPSWPPGHEGHHMHFDGPATVCSCGLCLGICSFIPDPRCWSDDPAEVAQMEREEADFNAWITCRVCGQHGVMLADDGGVWPPRTISA